MPSVLESWGEGTAREGGWLLTPALRVGRLDPHTDLAAPAPHGRRGAGHYLCAGLGSGRRAMSRWAGSHVLCHRPVGERQDKL